DRPRDRRHSQNGGNVTASLGTIEERCLVLSGGSMKKLQRVIFAICLLQIAVSKAWAGCGTPRVDLRINNQPSSLNGWLQVCPNGPIILDGSQSNCAESHFISIELSDQFWNRKGGELTHWYSAKDDQHLYGKISHFDLKSWAEHNHFKFV